MAGDFSSDFSSDFSVNTVSPIGSVNTKIAIVTGSSADIQSRILRVIPRYWFSFSTTIFNAVLGGLSDSAAWSYSLIIYAQKQARLATAIGPFLDIWAYDYLGRYLTRNGSNDSVFRAKIKATVLQERVTRAGMVKAITALVGTAPKIFEPWNTFDTGACRRHGAYYIWLMDIAGVDGVK